MAGIKAFDPSTFKFDASQLYPHDTSDNITIDDIPTEMDGDAKTAVRLIVNSPFSYIISFGLKQLFAESSTAKKILQERFGDEKDSKFTAALNKILDFEDGKDASSLGGKRYYHALKRLKEKGLYAENTKDLRTKMEDRSRIGLPTAFDMSIFGAVTDINERYFSVPISDDIWIRAIELTMFFMEPDTYKDYDAMFARHLSQDKDIDLIYFMAYMLAFSKYASDENKKYRDKVKHLDMLDTQADEIERLKKQLADAESRCSETNRKNTALSAEMGEQKREYDKKINALEHDIVDIKKDMTEELNFVKRMNARLLGLTPTQDALEDAEDAMNFQFEDGDKSEDIEVFPNPLPESGVLFLGGHVNLVNKLRQRHPGWRYQSDNQFTATATTSIKLVFMWSDHMSHSLQDRVFSIIKDVPVLYLKATNLNRLEHEMKQKYNDFVENGICCRS